MRFRLKYFFQFRFILLLCQIALTLNYTHLNLYSRNSYLILQYLEGSATCRGTGGESGRRFNVDAADAGRKCQLRHLCGLQLQIKICAVCMKGFVQQI